MHLLRVGSIILVLMSGKAIAQDSLYTMPLNTARKLVGDALRYRMMDSINVVKDQRIRELESELSQSQKLAAQADGHFKEVIAAHIEKTAIEKERGDHYQKELRKARRINKILKIVSIVGPIAGVFLGSR